MLSTNPTLFLDAPQPHYNFLSRYQFSTPKATPLRGDGKEQEPISAPFQPSENDVVCGRGKGSYNQPGNKRFRSLAQQYVPEYTAAKTRLDKSMVLNKIVKVVQETGRFVKYDKIKGWFEISDDLAREKVGHTIREAVSASSAEPKPETKPMFVNKHSDLLAQQKALFASLMRDKNYETTAV